MQVRLRQWSSMTVVVAGRSSVASPVAMAIAILVINHPFFFFFLFFLPPFPSLSSFFYSFFFKNKNCPGKSILETHIGFVRFSFFIKKNCFLSFPFFGSLSLLRFVRFWLLLFPSFYFMIPVVNIGFSNSSLSLMGLKRFVSLTFEFVPSSCKRHAVLSL